MATLWLKMSVPSFGEPNVPEPSWGHGNDLDPGPYMGFRLHEEVYLRTRRNNYRSSSNPLWLRHEFLIAFQSSSGNPNRPEEDLF